MTAYNTWFNWTTAYSLNAHIARPYGICLPNREKVWKDPSSITDAIRKVYGKRADSIPWTIRKMPFDYSSFNHVEVKTRLVLWAVSNSETPSRRENYANELKDISKLIKLENAEYIFAKKILAQTICSETTHSICRLGTLFDWNISRRKFEVAFVTEFC